MHAFSKAVAVLTDPLALILLLLAATALAHLFGWLRLARCLTFAALGFAAIVGLTPLPEWSLRQLEHRIEAPTIDWNAVGGVVVLGGATGNGLLAAEHDTYLLSGAAERLTTAAGLSRRHPDLPIIVAGFSHLVHHQGLSEGELSRRLFVELGIAPERFLYEERSRNTYENAREARPLIGDSQSDWVLVTSAFHMPRAIATFQAAGMSVIPYPVDYRAPNPRRAWLRFDVGARFHYMELALKEWVGLVAYRLLGRADTLLPS